MPEKIDEVQAFRDAASGILEPASWDRSNSSFPYHSFGEAVIFPGPHRGSPYTWSGPTHVGNAVTSNLKD